MAEKPTYKSLNAKLEACANVSELFKLAQSDDFRADAQRLPADELTQLRQDYLTRQNLLDGRVKLEVFAGRIVRIVNVEWWHSDTYDQGATGGEGVTLYVRPEQDFDFDGVRYTASKRYKASTSSAVIVRYANRFANAVPSEDAPARAELKLVPVSDPQRAAQGQRRWDIKHLPTPIATGASPF